MFRIKYPVSFVPDLRSITAYDRATANAKTVKISKTDVTGG
jgi:hypothetical protein